MKKNELKSKHMISKEEDDDYIKQHEELLDENIKIKKKLSEVVHEFEEMERKVNEFG